MNTTNKLPLSGYSIERIYANDLGLHHKDPSDGVGEVSFSWDWRIAGKETFEVLLSVKIGAAEERREAISASIVGKFRQTSPEPTVSLLDFVKLQAPAILLPYVRQLLSMLTTQSFYGPYFLPPVNMVRVMADFVPENAEGARQLAGGATISVTSGDRGLIEETSGGSRKQSSKKLTSKAGKSGRKE